jgi:hypothetical protein
MTEARLGRAGRRFVEAIERLYEMNPAEREILTMAGHQLDEIGRLTRDVAATPTRMQGSRGATLADPLLAQVRQHRAAFVALVTELHLDGEAAARTGSMVSELARTAAMKRWHGGVKVVS